MFCVVNNFTRKKFFMAMLAFEDDSHFEKINLIVTAMAVLMLGWIPVVYAHNQDWNDQFWCC
jgi:hypothetical protein